MKENEYKVTFQPSGRSAHVLQGTRLLEAAGLAGIILDAACGGTGTCEKCRVRILNGNAPGWVLSCQARVEENMVVEVPSESVFAGSFQILSDDSGKDAISLVTRELPDGALGMAFDIGTTTVVGTLFDMKAGAELGVASAINAQVVSGDDVISRILRVREDSEALTELQGQIIKTANGIVSELVDSVGKDAKDIHEVVIAGNSTMQQIFCGMDVSPLGEVPFAQAFSEAINISASSVGLDVADGAQLFVLGQVDGFVGGDTVAGILASRIDRSHENVLLVDIGTNGEIVLAGNNRILAASTAAGPAFEGARIRHGMRAAEGAIEKVIVGETVIYNVIGDTAPSGICGTALIDLVAGLLEKGIIDETGRILSIEELPNDTSEELMSRIGSADGGNCFIVAGQGETLSGEDICLFQKDVREFQLATGAIRAGTTILLKNMGLAAQDIDIVLLAGAFGNFIRRSCARRVGLLPDIPCERMRFIGNAASLGAKLALLSLDEREYAEKLRAKTEHVDLSSSPEFQSYFSEGMIFPS